MNRPRTPGPLAAPERRPTVLRPARNAPATGKARLASTGSTASGSNQVTAVTSIATWSVGDAISGAGIPANTTVAVVDAGTNTLTLSANATATAAGVALADAAFRSVLLV